MASIDLAAPLSLKSQTTIVTSVASAKYLNKLAGAKKTVCLVHGGQRYIKS